MQRKPSTDQQVIQIHPQAPAKPAFGAACNGCGLCCLAEPCPLGVLLSRSRKGPCMALRWQPDIQQYRCGALGAAGAADAAGLLARAWARLRARLVARWIAAGSGCDCDLEPAASATIHPSSPAPSEPPHD
jgi:hypothetical protein